MHTIIIKEYDDVGGVTECVHWDTCELPSFSIRDITRHLAAGDYSKGGKERFVEAYLGDQRLGTWTAPAIRRSAAAIRGAAKRAGLIARR